MRHLHRAGPTTKTRARFAAASVLLLVAACGSGLRVTRPPSPAGTFDLFENLPPGTAAVIRLDLGGALASPLWRRFGPAFVARADLQPFGTLLERECGLDLGRDVIELDLALAPDLRPEGSTLFMRGRFTPASIHRCIGAVWRATGQGTLVSETHGRISELVSDSGRRMYIGWPTADTMALNMRAVAGDRSVLGWLEESPAPVHRTLVGASRLLAPGSCIGLLALVTGKTAEGFPRAILHLRPDLLWLNLHHEAGMTAELGFRFASERLAREFRDGTMREIQAAAEHPAIARLVSSLSVSVAGPELRFVLSLDEAELEAAFDELVARYPGLRGGPTP